MHDETPQPEPAAQTENTNPSDDPAIERSITGSIINDAVQVIAPAVPIVTAWGLAKLDQHNESKPDAPEIILPPGVNEEK
jgi:hypothetical protein